MALAGIAASQRVSVSELNRLNRIDRDGTVRAGRTLRLPDQQPALVASAAAAAAATAVAQVAPVVVQPPSGPASATPPSAAEMPRIYVVRAGDSLAEISARVSVPQSRLVTLNNIRNPDSIYEGQRLKLVEDEAGVSAGDLKAAQAAEANEALTERLAETRVASSATAAAQTPEPVNASEAREEPSLVPGGAVPQASDPVDYAVAANGTIRVAAAETLGHYADWLGVPTASLRTLNGLAASRSVAQGRLLKLDLSRVTREQFEARRRAYHQTLQAEFFAGHRIIGTEVYVARRGDSLWVVTQRHARVPAWLLQQYNPDVDFADLRAGVELVIPKVEVLPAV